MNTTSTFNRAAYFGLALARATLTDLQTTGLSLGTPLFLLFIFGLVSKGPALQQIFPTLIGLTAMLGGQGLMMKLINWRTQGVFQRLAATPTPLGALVMGAGGTQVLMNVLQAAVILLVGVFILAIPVNAAGAALALGVAGLCALCFVAYGMAIAALARTPDIASMLFIFTLLPMYYLGGGIFAEALPEWLNTLSAWLPTAVLSKLMTPLVTGQALTMEAAWATLAILVYTAVFSAFAAWRFRWE
jgi:ABC-2 type transport system permease protein